MIKNSKRLSLAAALVMACWMSSSALVSAQVTMSVPYDFYEAKDNTSQTYGQIFIDQSQCQTVCNSRKSALITTITGLGLTVVSDSIIKNEGSIIYAHFDAELNLWEYEVDWTLTGNMVVSGTQGQINALRMLLGLGLAD